MSRGCSFGSVGLGLGWVPVFWGIIEINYSVIFFVLHRNYLLKPTCSEPPVRSRGRRLFKLLFYRRGGMQVLVWGSVSK